MSENVTIKQHYIPQLILRRFRGSGNKIWVLNESRKAKATGTASVLQEEYLYASSDEQIDPTTGEFIIDNRTEDRLGVEIETPMGLTLKNIDENRLVDTDKDVLLKFTATLLTRNPTVLQKSVVGGKRLAEDICCLAEATSTYDEFRDKFQRITLGADVSFDEWDNIVSNPAALENELSQIDELSFHEINKEWNEDVIFEGADVIKTFFHNVDLIIHRFSDPCLVLSDNPVLFKLGKITEHCLVPLGSTTLLEISEGSGQYSLSSDSSSLQIVALANNWSKSTRVKWLVGHSKRILEPFA